MNKMENKLEINWNLYIGGYFGAIVIKLFDINWSFLIIWPAVWILAESLSYIWNNKKELEKQNE